MPIAERRSTLALTSCAFALLSLTGCGGGDEPRLQPQARSHSTPAVVAPAWVRDPFSQSQVGAVGISIPVLLREERFARALADGRAKLAETIQARVQRAYTRYSSEALGNGMALTDQVDESSLRTLTDQVLTGSRQRDYWEDPVTQDLYVWVVLDPSATGSVVSQAASVARDAIAADAQLRAELKAHDALDRLDAMLAESVNGE